MQIILSLLIAVNLEIAPFPAKMMTTMIEKSLKSVTAFKFVNSYATVISG